MWPCANLCLHSAGHIHTGHISSQAARRSCDVTGVIWITPVTVHVIMLVRSFQWRHIRGLAFPMTSNSTVCSTVCWGCQQRKHRSTASVVLCEGNPFVNIEQGMFRLISFLQYIPRNMHTVFALLCFVVVIHWLIFPYPSGLLHWHCGNLTIAPVPAKQPWWIWINTSCEFIMNDCITTTKQSTTKPCAYFLGYTVCPLASCGSGNSWLNWKWLCHWKEKIVNLTTLSSLVAP